LQISDYSQYAIEWTVRSSNGNLFTQTTVDKNELFIKREMLSANELYKVCFKITKGDHVGYACNQYDTSSISTFTFSVNPTSGYAYDTEFSLTLQNEGEESETYEFEFGMQFEKTVDGVT